jgi:hypothetical protein
MLSGLRLNLALIARKETGTVYIILETTERKGKQKKIF